MMTTIQTCRPRRASLTFLLLLPLCATAQRADDNAVKSADDAFGTSVGSENIGLYNAFEVRGFSAVDAGNMRLEGLYFDRQTDPHRLLAPSSTMRVGISAQGYLLPAPTGIADYELARAGDELRLSPVLGYGPFDSRFAELEVELPLVPERFGVAGGVLVANDAYEGGNNERAWVAAIAPRFRAGDSVEIIPFYSRVAITNGETAPLVFVSDAHLPPEVERTHFCGQDWTDNENVGDNYGVVANFALARNWAINAGQFRSQYAAPISFADLYLDTSRDGFGRHVLIAEHDQRYSSTSGELRVSKLLAEGSGVMRSTIRCAPATSSAATAVPTCAISVSRASAST